MCPDGTSYCPYLKNSVCSKTHHGICLARRVDSNPLKSIKNMHQKKSYQQNKFDEHEKK
jgi:hypothetical protein